MKQILKVKHSAWIGNNMMIHICTDGKSYYGPPLPATKGNIVVETSKEPIEGGSFYIVKILGTD